MPESGPRSFHALIPLLVVAVLTAVILLRLPKRERYGFLSGYYLILRHLIERKGLKVRPSSTPSEVARETSHLDTAADIREFIAIYEKCRFGGSELTAEDRKRYLDLLAKIKIRLKS